ncbi:MULTISPECIES: hypothetical protein [Vibrio]|uniref:Uncharacterized protein n=1 Tax=Vibrio hippocampi TaxID=654686 RepID=A0ABM8ZPE5_9VIBR|nr:hypothetical protein [Vibrio hippocampi]CAH0531251.1 hypothetical protein VHP8226_04188 [Vibrio hippocampi]
MSHAQYTAISKTRLIDLANVPAGQLMQFLATRPSWVRDQVLATLAKGA